MIRDEQKPTKRIKRSFSRKELYHRFIHSPELCYCRKGHSVTGIDNYLHLGCNVSLSKNPIESMWFYHKDYTIAIVDRELKRIIVKINNNHTWELLQAVPDDWQIFFTDKPIEKYDILRDDSLLFKTHLKYLIENYCRTSLLCFYKVLNTKSKICSIDLDYAIHKRDDAWVNNKTYQYISRPIILKFINDFKIKNFDWYNKSLSEEYRLNVSSSYTASYIKVKLPSPKKIKLDSIFTPKEKLFIEKCVFYTKYAYGEGISFKEVDENFNKALTEDLSTKFRIKHPLNIIPEFWHGHHCWNDLVMAYSKVQRTRHDSYVTECIKESNKNRQVLLDLMCDGVTVNNWREGKCVAPKDVPATYRKFIPPKTRNQRGTWVNEKIIVGYCSFQNTQLKLVKDRVITSRGASVSLSEAINGFRTFTDARLYYPNRQYIGANDLKIQNIYVGLYNIRFIEYVDKKTDSVCNGVGTSIGHKEWLIQIGCHSLWLDDIINFIKYYHLENEFKLNQYEIYKKYL